jgi:hypothetical protein
MTALNRGWFVLALALALTGCDDEAQGSNAPAYLYRGSLVSDVPVYVGAFDTHDKAPGFNIGNCQDVADLEAKGPGRSVRWWCEERKNPRASGI